MGAPLRASRPAVCWGHPRKPAQPLFATVQRISMLGSFVPKNGLRGGVELPKRFWCRKVFVRRRQGRYLVNVDGKDGAGFGAKSVCHKGPTNHLAAAARLNAAVSRVSRAVFSPDGPCWMYVQRRAHYGRLSISSRQSAPSAREYDWCGRRRRTRYRR